MGNIRLAVFDVDGVLLDSDPVHSRSVKRVLERYGVHGYNPMGHVGMSSQDMFAELIERYGIDATPDRLIEEMTDLDFEDILQQKLPESEGLTPLLDCLQEAGVRLSVASSSERRFVGWTLHYLGIADRLASSAAGLEGPRKKPYPDLYLRAVELAGVSPSSAVAIEDSATGIRAAKNAGLYCVGYRNPTSGKQDLHEADFIVDSLLQAAPFILSL